MKTQKIIVIVAITMLASACASPARVQNMTVAPTASLATVEKSIFKNNLRVVNVYGGGETNPMWTSQVSGAAFDGALRNSLEAYGLASISNPDPRFEVVATLSQLDQPMFGIDMTVKSNVSYEVIEAKTRESWFDKQILASYTATFSDAALGMERLKLANEGSIRENIRIFIEKLLQTPQKQALK